MISAVRQAECSTIIERYFGRMQRTLFSVVTLSALLAVSSTTALQAAPPAQPVEKLNYSWSLKGALAWLVRAAVPTSGNGTLETHTTQNVHSRLLLTGSSKKEYFVYESQMDGDGRRTQMSMDGYRWNSRSHEQRVWFDGDRRTARVTKTSEDGVETKMRNIPSNAPQDVLTSIYFLRQHADEVTTPRAMQIYTAGKPYTFRVVPKPVTTTKVGNQTYRVRPFVMTPVSDDKRGEVRVWFSDDERRIPVRIEMEQKYGTLKLDVK
jgi:hypothetical protein